MSLRRFAPSFSAALVFTAAVVSAPSLHAQDWAKATLAKSPRHGEYVTIAEPGGRKLQAWVVYPEIKDKAPVVVMIHEIFGLSDWAREMADELAGAGYIVVEPDLLSGYGPATAHAAISAKDIQRMSTTDAQMMHTQAVGMGCDLMNCGPEGKPARAVVQADGSIRLEPSADTVANPETVQPSAHFLTAAYDPQQQDHSHMSMPMQSAGAAFVPAEPGGTAAFPDMSATTKAVSSLPSAGVMTDLDAAADYGKKLPAANGKLFVAGFCWGGTNSFLFATHRKDLSAAFVFYGTPPSADQMKAITAPVYGFYAENDARVSATIPQATADMKAAGKTYEPVTYDGAGHGFMRAGEAPDASAANSAARAAGFRRLVTLLGGVR